MEGELYQEGELEEIEIGDVEIAEIREVAVANEGLVETTTEAAVIGKVKGKKDNRNYVVKPLEEFEALDTRAYPCPAPEINFERKGEERNSINMYRDKKPWEIADDLLRDIADHTVKMCNLHKRCRRQEAYDVQVRAFIGNSLFPSYFATSKKKLLGPWKIRWIGLL